MGILLVPNKKIYNIKIHYIETTENNCSITILNSNKEIKKWLNKGYSMSNDNSFGEKVIQELNLTLQRLSWGEYNEIYSRSIFAHVKENMSEDMLNGILFKELLLKRSIVRWDLSIMNPETQKQNPLPLSEVSCLPSELAEEIIRIIEENISPSERDLKNLKSAAKSFYTGKKIRGLFPSYIYEHLIAKFYKWDLEKIRNMDYYDFQVHVVLCVAAEDAEIEFRQRLAGSNMMGQSSKTGKQLIN